MKRSNVVKIRCKHLLTIPNERLQRWQNVLVVAKLFKLVNDKRNGGKEKGSLEWPKAFHYKSCAVLMNNFLQHPLDFNKYTGKTTTLDTA